MSAEQPIALITTPVDGKLLTINIPNPKEQWIAITTDPLEQLLTHMREGNREKGRPELSEEELTQVQQAAQRIIAIFQEGAKIEVNKENGEIVSPTVSRLERFDDLIYHQPITPVSKKRKKTTFIISRRVASPDGALNFTQNMIPDQVRTFCRSAFLYGFEGSPNLGDKIAEQQIMYTDFVRVCALSSAWRRNQENTNTSGGSRR